MFGRTVGSWLLAASVALGGVARAADVDRCDPMSAAEESFSRGMLAALEDPDDEVVARALLSLDVVVDCSPGIRERLQTFLRTPHAARAQGAGAGMLWKAVLITRASLGEASAEDAATLVDLALEDPKTQVPKAARWALRKMGEATRGQAERLVDLALDDTSYEKSQQAKRALNAMGAAARGQIPRLVERLKSPKREIRERTAELMGYMGEAAWEQAPHLVDLLLKESDLSVRKSVAAALEALGEGARGQIRVAAALEALGEGARGQIPRLVKLLKDPDPRVRQAAVSALASMGSVAREQLPALGERLKDPDPKVRALAADAVAELGQAGVTDPKLAPRLGALLEDPDETVREEAAYALGYMGEAAREYLPRIVELLEKSAFFGPATALVQQGEAAREQAPRIAQLLDSPIPLLRMRAVIILGRMDEAGRAWVPRITALLKDPLGDLRSAAARALGALGAREQAPRIAELLKDPSVYVRQAAVETLEGLGAREQIPVPSLLLLIQEADDRALSMADQDRDVHAENVVSVLLAMTPLGLQDIAAVVGMAGKYPAARFKWLTNAHGLGGGDPQVERMLRWLGWRGATGLPHGEQLPLEELRATLKDFAVLWPFTASDPELRDDLAQQISLVALLGQGRWTAEDVALLAQHEKNLRPVQPMRAAGVHAAWDAIAREAWWKKVAWGWAAHAGFWVLLLFFYPRSAQVQAVFFWNPWVRRLLGLGYVGVLLTWVPLLRRRLLAPFRPLLLADADLERFSPEGYFEHSEVRVAPTGQRLPLLKALPRLKGQVVLQGASGLGKSMFIKHLLSTSKALAVYLPAERCGQGVLEAIQAKLEGHARDSTFLQSILYSGALDLYIDGLNEVSADTRTRIVQFVEPKFRGNMLLATQRMEWTPPATARLYELQPLTEAQVRDFLLSREPLLGDDGRVRGEAYRAACEHFLTLALCAEQPRELRQAMLEVLSNPMDLTVVARMLAVGHTPDLFHLRQQQYELMARDYQEVNLSEFPLEVFCEEAYRMRLEDRGALSEEQFGKELLRLEAYKLVARREWRSPDGTQRREWHFRHDKMQDFFITQALLGPHNTRILEHMEDPRFRGVYFLLARLLEPERALELQELLVERAAETRDHTVSDEFVNLFKARRRVEQARDVPQEPPGSSAPAM